MDPPSHTGLYVFACVKGRGYGRVGDGLHLAYWLKHWTADRKVQGSSPTCSRDLFLFRVHSALPQKLSRRFNFVSFGGDIKSSVLGNPLKLAYVSAIGSFLVNVIPSKPTYITVSLFLHSLTPTTLYLSLATRCPHSVSRSTKLLRTSIVNVEVWRLVLEMLSLRDEECMKVASGVACNLLLAFSPSREVI